MNLKILILNLNYFFKETFSSLRKSFLLNLATIVSIGLSLLILAVAFVGWWSSEEITAFIREDAEMAVFYADELSTEERNNLQDVIANMDGVVSLQHVDEETAYQQMEDLMGEDVELLASLGENPFDSFFSVNVQPEEVAALAEDISAVSGVEYVRDNQELISQFQSISNTISYIGMALTIIVGITTMIITSQIIRLGIVSKEEQINMLKLLGASKGFISIPFILEGMVLAGLGGVLASALLLILLPYGQELVMGSLPFIPVPPVMEILPIMAVALICLGLVFGFLGSLVSLRFTREERI